MSFVGALYRGECNNLAWLDSHIILALVVNPMYGELLRQIFECNNRSWYPEGFPDFIRAWRLLELEPAYSEFKRFSGEAETPGRNSPRSKSWRYLEREEAAT